MRKQIKYYVFTAEQINHIHIILDKPLRGNWCNRCGKRDSHPRKYCNCGGELKRLENFSLRQWCNWFSDEPHLGGMREEMLSQVRCEMLDDWQDVIINDVPTLYYFVNHF